MTERVVIEHDFECSEKGFWDTFLNLEYNQEMFLSEMKFERWELVKFDKTDEKMERVVEVEPYVGQLPGPIKKVIGEKVAYREEGRLDRINNVYELHVIPGILPGKVQVTGRQYTKSLSENRCRRTFEATVDVKVFGIGSMIEKQIAADMRKSYDAGARFTQNYMKRNGVQ